MTATILIGGVILVGFMGFFFGRRSALPDSESEAGRFCECVYPRYGGPPEDLHCQGCKRPI